MKTFKVKSLSQIIGKKEKVKNPTTHLVNDLMKMNKRKKAMRK